MGSSITFSPENGFATSTGALSIISTSKGGLGTRCKISLAIFVLLWFVVDNLVDDQSAYHYRYQADRQHSESVPYRHYIFSSYRLYHCSSMLLYSSISSEESIL